MENKQDNEENQSKEALSGQNVEQTLRSIRYLLLGAITLSIFSLFLPGGFFLSIGGVICAVIVLYKVIKTRSGNPGLKESLDRIYTISIVCTVICGVIFALNAIAVFVIYPMMVEMIQSGALEEAGVNTDYLKELLGESSGNTSKW